MLCKKSINIGYLHISPLDNLPRSPRIFVSSFHNMSLWPHIMDSHVSSNIPNCSRCHDSQWVLETHHHAHASMLLYKHEQLDENGGLSGNISILFTILNTGVTAFVFCGLGKIATQRLNDLSEQCTSEKRLILSILNREHVNNRGSTTLRQVSFVSLRFVCSNFLKTSFLNFVFLCDVNFSWGTISCPAFRNAFSLAKYETCTYTKC